MALPASWTTIRCTGPTKGIKIVGQQGMCLIHRFGDRRPSFGRLGRDGILGMLLLVNLGCQQPSAPVGETQPDTVSVATPQDSAKAMDIQDPNAVFAVAEGEFSQFLATIDQHLGLKRVGVSDAVDCAGLEQLCRLKELVFLSLTNCECATLPTAFGELSQLEYLHYVLDPDQPEIPQPILQLHSLKRLHIEGDALRKVPVGLTALKGLEEVNFGDSPIEKLPDFLGKLPELKTIYLGMTEGIEAEGERFHQKFPAIEVAIQ
jgi:hypothetical protein